MKLFIYIEAIAYIKVIANIKCCIY